MEKKLIGLHSPVYITLEELEQQKSQCQTLSMMMAAGIVDQPSALEILAVKVLYANGHINFTPKRES